MRPACTAKFRALLLRAALIVFLIALTATFGILAPAFLTWQNLNAVLLQSSWLMVVALGMNFVLLTAGVDLSVGSVMYLAAVTVCLGLRGMPLSVCIAGAIGVGAAVGAVNGALIVRARVPAFIVTLSTLFVGRGLGFFLSSTRVLHADPEIATLGRAAYLGFSAPLWMAALALAAAWLLFKQTAFGLYLRGIGSDAEGARRAGVLVKLMSVAVYILCGAAAGLGGLISLSQTAAASGAFGQNAEFLAIAAAVLGGTSLFGGRGSLLAPVIGAVLITTIQNGLAMIDANPYAYPVITGGVIFAAALVDSLRLNLLARWTRRPVAALSKGA